MSVKDIFDKAALELIAEIRQRMVQEGVNATGKTSASLEHTATDSQMTILGSKAFIWVEKGRRAGRNPPFSPILEWVEAKGIGGINPVGVAWAVVKSIGARGSVTFRGGDFRDIYTSVVTEQRLEKIFKDIADAKVINARSEIVERFRGQGVTIFKQ